MALTYDIAGAQIDGARDYQEDAFLTTNLKDKDGNPTSLVIVADGMGGHAAGNVASNMAVQAFNKHVSANYPTDEISEVLNGAVLKANHSIAETIKETPALDGMGCTMVALLIEKDKIWWASVGDSHLYLIRNRELNKINADHSYGGFLDAMEAAGTPVEPEPGLSRNMLMSAVTGADISDIDCPPSPLQLQAGDKILVCSDGLDTLSDGKIIQYCDWSDSPKECADALLNAVEEADMPKQDNTTVVVINILDKDAAGKAPEPEEDDDDDDEDITDTSGYKRPDLEKTTDMAEEETAEHDIVPDDEPQFETGPAEAQSVSAEPVSEAPPETAETAPRAAEEPGKGGGKGLVIGIAALILVAVAGGGYFFMSSKETPIPQPASEEPDTVADADEPEAPLPPPEEMEEEISADAEEAMPEAEAVAEEPTPEAAETPAPAVEEEPASIAVKPGSEIQDPLKGGGMGPVMVTIPGGTFEMGSPNTSANADERPRHTVQVDSFAMSKYEITFAEYDRFAEATDRKLPDDLYMDRDTSPVIFISWDDAYNYAKWLSEQTGHQYRLATEAEWEYAASGGRKSSFWWGFDEKPGMAHCFTCDSQYDPRKPTRIGSFEPNPYGLYDTAGNVAEWVHDCWHENYKAAPTDGSVWEGGDCSQRVARGGSYISPQQSIRSAKRDKFRSDSGYDHVGIRVVREIE